MINTLNISCNQAVVQDFRIRKLTPKECWRLMGFKDEQFEIIVSNINVDTGTKSTKIL